MIITVINKKNLHFKQKSSGFKLSDKYITQPNHSQKPAVNVNCIICVFVYIEELTCCVVASTTPSCMSLNMGFFSFTKVSALVAKFRLIYLCLFNEKKNINKKERERHLPGYCQ